MKFYNLIALAGLLTLSACNQQDAPIDTERKNSTEIDTREKVSLAFDLSGEARMIFDGEDKTRAIPFEVKDDAKGANIAPIEAKTLYSIVVVSDENGTETHTFDLEWTKSDKVENRYFVKEIGKDDIKGKKVPKLDLNKKWFISGVLTTNKANINLQTGKIHFNPNTDIGPVSNGTGAGGKNQIDKDIPLYFEWTELTVPTENDGKDVLSTEKTTQKFGTPYIKIRPMGVLMRIKLRNDNTYPVRVKSLRVFSSVLATSNGSIDLTNYNRQRKSEEILYVPDHVGEDDFYPVPNFDLNEDQEYPHDFLIWGIPVTPKTTGGTTYFTGRPFSQLILDVKRLDDQGLEQDKPKMDALYVWGSEKNNPKQATRLRINAKILRPMGLLEYYSEGYWTGNKTGELFTIDTARSVYKSGTEVYNMLTNNNELPDGYKPMQYNDARLLFPNWSGAPNLIISKADSPEPIGGSQIVRFPGEQTDTQVNDTIQIKNGILYALRHNDGKGAGKRKHLSAWRYNYDDATIEMVYLGSTFKGVFTDILKPEFWTNHQDDIIKRTYAPAKSKFVKETDRKPVEWYYVSYADSVYGVTSDILLTAIGEIYRTKSGTSVDMGSGARIEQAYGIHAYGLVRGRGHVWAPGAFRSGNKSLVTFARRKESDPPLPPNVHFGTNIKSVRIQPVVLVKKTADY